MYVVIIWHDCTNLGKHGIKINVVKPRLGDSVTLNYEAISEQNRHRYGTAIGRIGPMLLADCYDERTHFIFELLQNAEDAPSRFALSAKLAPARHPCIRECHSGHAPVRCEH